MSRIKTIGLNVLLVCVPVVFVIIVVEGMLRFTPYANLLPYSGIPKYYYAADPDTGYAISNNFASSTHRFADGSYTIWSNNLGCFDEPYNGEQPYIYLGGDSFTWGFTPFADKWGTELESLLGVRVVKCGIPGYGTKQELIKATKTLSQLPRPSNIIVGYFINDRNDDAAFPNSLVYQGQLIKNLSNEPGLTYDELLQRLPQYAQWAQEYCMWNMPPHPLLQRTKCYLRNHSILYLLAQSTIKNIIPKPFLRKIGIVNEEPVTPTASDENFGPHLANVGGFSTLAKQMGSPLLFVLVPPKEDVYSTATSTTYTEEKTYMQKEQIEYFDPLPSFRAAAAATSSSLYWNEDPHLNPAGNHLLGLLVAQYLFEKKHDNNGLTHVKGLLSTEFGI